MTDNDILLDCLLFILSCLGLPIGFVLGTSFLGLGEWNRAAASFAIILLSILGVSYSLSDHRPLSDHRTDGTSDTISTIAATVESDSPAVTNRPDTVPASREPGCDFANHAARSRTPRPKAPAIVDGTIVREVCVDGLAWLSQKDAYGANTLTQILIPGPNGTATPKICGE